MCWLRALTSAVSSIGLPAAVEIGLHLAEHVRIARFLEIGQDDALCIGVGLRSSLAEEPRGPEAEQLVAASRRLETKLLVMGELLLEGIPTLVEPGHWHFLSELSHRDIKAHKHDHQRQAAWGNWPVLPGLAQIARMRRRCCVVLAGGIG